MKKRIVSLLLALCLCVGLVSMMAFATDNAATITAFDASGVQMGTTYTTITAAANAAGANGTVCISEGVLAVNSRQDISVAGVTLEGAGKDATKIVPSATFKDGTVSARKTLLAVSANNVTLENLSLDGTSYGETIDMSNKDQYDFSVLRLNSGSDIVLNSIYVTGSPKTLIQIGTSTTSATVTANELYCDGMAKSITDGSTYADIDVTNASTLTVNSGAINAFIANDGTSNYTIGEACEPLFTLRHMIFFKLTATFQHFVNTYVALRDDVADLARDYASDIGNLANRKTVDDMVTRAEAVAGTDPTSVQNFIIVLEDAKALAPLQATVLNGFITRLQNALANAS